MNSKVTWCVSFLFYIFLTYISHIQSWKNKLNSKKFENGSSSHRISLYQIIVVGWEFIDKERKVTKRIKRGK